MGKAIKLHVLEGRYGISRMSGDAAIPSWADGKGFVSITRNGDELSIVCPIERIPADIQSDREWVCLRFVGPFAFGEPGIVLSVIRPLSENGLGVFLVSTFDGDCLLLKSEDAEAGKRLLAAAGHTILEGKSIG
ncbi:ACT domain-containing protein [Dyella mobilis]|uniref:ACT domain-containing protein n=1 Tax=Dyella mobilis TaxID=1849582 RepID=A0ABS2KDT6_9GAMM|nr:ACT domain-containing protein [Dyella mobilis]MBM7129010.1 ACT domain-containing protein [Dyella mobilis]GLQ99294.1 ACT domain-containing protein [Dyella mobilis]